MPYFCRNYRKSKSICLITLSLLMSQGVVRANTLIYGLDKAHQVNSSAKGPFYIQLASFSTEESANHYLQRVKLKFSYPVTIERHHSSYAIRLGPIGKARDVRQIVMVERQTSPHIKQKNSIRVSQIPTVIVPSDKPQLLTGSWVIGADMGITLPRPNKTMTTANLSEFEPQLDVDPYTTHHNNHPILAVQVGRRWEHAQHWLPAHTVALKYQHMFTKDIDGNVTQYSSPEYNNYSYHWGVAAEVFSLNGKVDIVKIGKVMPYVDAGLGVSINRSRSYRESAYSDVTPRTSPGFSSNAQGQFYYNLGAGLDAILTPHLIASIGYDFQSFGLMRSGQGQLDWHGEELHNGHFSSNTVLVGVTYAFGDSLL